MFDILAIPFGYIMKACYMLVKNYGVALILFTFITKLLMFPLNIKQQKSTAKSAKLTPKLNKLKQKYGKDQAKYNEEMTKLYAEEGVSMTGGCLPALIPMLLLFAMIRIIYAPLTYITDVDKSEITKAENLVKNIMTVSTEIKSNSDSDNNTFAEIKANNDDVYSVLNDKDKFKNTSGISENNLKEVIDVFEQYDGLDEYFADETKVTPNLKTNPQLLVFRIVEDGKGDFFTQEVRDAASEINYEIFGIFLGDYPSWKSILVLIPILSLATQLILTFVSQHYTKKNNPAAPSMGGMNMIMYLMPLISFFIAFKFPAGIGLYWIAQSMFGLLQVILVNKIYTPEYVDKLNEKDKAKHKKSGKKTFMEKALEAQNMNPNAPQKTIDIDDDDDEERKLSKNEIREQQRKRLNEARRKMAEKYGDDYKED